MKNFLCSISNYNINVLRVLRSFIQCVLLRNNQYQVALYLYGPGGTGKSTFEKLLISLVGSSNSSVLSLEDLNRQFTVSKIMDKSLVLFSDVQSYNGDPSKLKLLISGDVMNAERKYKDSFDLQPESLVVLSSNALWNTKDSSTGLQRRIIFIHMHTIPTEVNRDLFIINLNTDLSSGILSESLPGLVNWALDNPVNNSVLLQNAVETTRLLSPMALSDANPLVNWILNYLYYESDSFVYIGKKNSDPNTHLFPHYLRYCNEYGHKPLSFNMFSTMLLQQLNVLVNRNIEKKRNTQGTGLTNIILNAKSIIINEDSLESKENIKDEFNNY